LRAVVLPDSGGVARNERSAPAGVGLCRHHVLQRPGAHFILDSGAHGCFRDVSASGAGILFFSVLDGSFAVVDVSPAANGARGFSIADRRLTRLLTAATDPATDHGEVAKV
jgi:hypothetical protein